VIPYPLQNVKLSIIIPTHNEDEAIETIIIALLRLAEVGWLK